MGSPDGYPGNMGVCRSDFSISCTLPVPFISIILTHPCCFASHQARWVEAWFPRDLRWGVPGTGECPAPVPAPWDP